MKNIARIVTNLLPVLFLAGCQATNPRDLQFESIDLISLAELPGVWDTIQSRSNVNSEAISFLKINLSTELDFIKLAKAHTLHVSSRAFTCDRGKIQGQPIFVLPYVRIGNFSLGDGPYSKLSELERFRNTQGRLTYYVLIPVAGEELKRLVGNNTSPDKTAYFSPNMSHVDICLQVTAAAMWFGTNLESNVVRVPAQEIYRLTD